MGKLESCFCPDRYYDRIASVDLEGLWAQGIRGFILDLDNTLVEWRKSDIPAEVLDWSRRARDMGYKLCIASNTRRYARLAKIADALGASYVTGVSKPRRGGFRNAVWKMHLRNAETAVIGDQVLTDMFGAKRTGLMAILVDRISDREFIVTKINRRVERIILNALRKSGKLPPVVCGGKGEA